MNLPAGTRCRRSDALSERTTGLQALASRAAGQGRASDRFTGRPGASDGSAVRSAPSGGRHLRYHNASPNSFWRHQGAQASTTALAVVTRAGEGAAKGVGCQHRRLRRVHCTQAERDLVAHPSSFCTSCAGRPRARATVRQALIESCGDGRSRQAASRGLDGVASGGPLIRSAGVGADHRRRHRTSDGILAVTGGEAEGRAKWARRARQAPPEGAGFHARGIPLVH